jgi:hypothetical protein
MINKLFSSNIELELENGILTFLLQRIYSQYMRIVVRLDKFGATDAQLALSWLYTMVLHPAGRIGSCSVHIAEL